MLARRRRKASAPLRAPCEPVALRGKASSRGSLRGCFTAARVSPRPSSKSAPPAGPCTRCSFERAA
eukprot:364538-Chlamydomonas_euryale.AAC.3